MLAIFQKAFAHPPEELYSPASHFSGKTPKLPGETLSDFLSLHQNEAFSMSFGDSAVLAYARQQGSLRHRLFCGLDGIYCMFLGRLNNLCTLNRQYGLTGKNSDEAMFLIEAYRTLRDRGPYPADQVLRGFEGSFGFVVYDSQTSSVFSALSSDGGESLYWGISGDGSVVMSDDLQIIKQGCVKSFAPFPTGCMCHSEIGVKSFEHPTNKMKAMPRIDSEGVICGANFKVDTCSKLTSFQPTNLIKVETTLQLVIVEAELFFSRGRIIKNMADPGGILRRWTMRLDILSFDIKQNFRVMNPRNQVLNCLWESFWCSSIN